MKVFQKFPPKTLFSFQKFVLARTPTAHGPGHKMAPQRPKRKKPTAASGANNAPGLAGGGRNTRGSRGSRRKVPAGGPAGLASPTAP